MHVTIVHVDVKRDFIANFIAATQDNHMASVQESGNVRFDGDLDVDGDLAQRQFVRDVHDDKVGDNVHPVLVGFVEEQ